MMVDARRSGSHAVNVVLVMAALAVAVSSIYQAFLRPGAQASSPLESEPTYIDFWQDALPQSLTMGGDTAASLKMVVLQDLECPACAQFHFQLADFLRERPTDLHALYLPMPLEYHRFSLGAARAADCAYDIGALGRWLDVVYAKQDSLGLKSWGSYAAEAGIRDTTQIHECAISSSVPERVTFGRVFASRVQAEFTPTIILNGWRLASPPTRAQLDSIVDLFLRNAMPE